MIPENFPLAENIGPGHVPRHGSVTGTATERQQPLPCRLQAPAGNAAVFPGQAPRFGEPFFLPMCRSVRTHQTAHGRTRQEKCRLPELPGRAAGKGLCRCAGHDGCRSTPVAREKTGVRRGRGRITVPRLMTALRQGPAVIAAGLRRWACLPREWNRDGGRRSFGPAIGPQRDGCGGKTAPPAGKEAPCCRRGLPFAGFWSMEARSSKHTPAAARGARQCATAHFSLSSGHGAGGGGRPGCRVWAGVEDHNPFGGLKNGLRQHEADAGNRRAFRSPDPSLEPQDASLHLRRPQRHPYHRPAADREAVPRGL